MRSDYALKTAQQKRKISIHAPLTRSDVIALNVTGLFTSISIHAPLTRSDAQVGIYSLVALTHFNPRPSYEERQFSLFATPPHFPFQSTPLLRGATSKTQIEYGDRIISIHAPLTRSDLERTVSGTSDQHFNPRPSYEERLHKGV